jgi:hypothetical protein
MIRWRLLRVFGEDRTESQIRAKKRLLPAEIFWNAESFSGRLNYSGCFKKYLPEMYEVFAAEKDKFGTSEESSVINILSAMLCIRLISALWKKQTMCT